jgi:hypothetical protein
VSEASSVTLVRSFATLVEWEKNGPKNGLLTVHKSTYSAPTTFHNVDVVDSIYIEREELPTIKQSLLYQAYTICVFEDLCSTSCRLVG